MAARRYSSGHESKARALIARARTILVTPFRILTSKYAVRAYVTSILFTITALVLLFFAIAAYTLFYWSYIPRIGFERVVHLQFDATAHEPSAVGTAAVSAHHVAPHASPWGIVMLSPDIASAQRYDVAVELHMPRTPANTGMGNFMLDVRLFAPRDKGSNVPLLNFGALKTGLLAGTEDRQDRLLAHSRRPAILTYYSPLVELARKASQLHWYLLGWRQEAEVLTVNVFEHVEFAKGWRNVPATLRLEMQSTTGAQMQVYAAKVHFRARFHGLRWCMYNHRVISAAVFVSAFWVTEVVFTVVAWGALSLFLFSGIGKAKGKEVKKIEEGDEEKSVKDEETDGMEELSDTERTFPTYGSQPPLRYQSPPIKREDEGQMGDSGLLAQAPAGLAAEADDEDDDADYVLDEGRWPRSDSGLGTSMESSAGRQRQTVRRRKSRPSDASI